MTQIPSHLGFDTDAAQIEAAYGQRKFAHYSIVPNTCTPELDGPHGVAVSIEDAKKDTPAMSLHIDTARVTQEDAVAMLKTLLAHIEESLDVNEFQGTKHGFSIVDRGPGKRAQVGVSW